MSDGPAVSDGPDVEALSHRYGPMVLRRCRRLLRSEEEARDVCQDVFVRVIEHRHRLDLKGLEVSLAVGWLFGQSRRATP